MSADGFIQEAENIVRRGGGVGSQSAGSVLPVGSPDGVTVDTTTYDDTLSGSGKYTTLVFPALGPGDDPCLLAIAFEGEAFPRIVLAADPTKSFFYANGSVDPINEGAATWIEGPDTNGAFVYVIEGGRGFTQKIKHGDLDPNAGYRTLFEAGIAIQTDQLNAEAVTISSANGAPAVGGNVGDLYIRKDGGDGSWIYRCTVAGVAGAATWVAKL